MRNDLLHCPVCAASYAREPNNKPRVLPCGDSICERCLLGFLGRPSDSHLELRCPVCSKATKFQLEQKGYVVINGHALRVYDSEGYVLNYFGLRSQEAIERDLNEYKKHKSFKVLSNSGELLSKHHVLKSLPLNRDIIVVAEKLRPSIWAAQDIYYDRKLGELTLGDPNGYEVFEEELSKMMALENSQKIEQRKALDQIVKQVAREGANQDLQAIKSTTEHTAHIRQILQNNLNLLKDPQLQSSLEKKKAAGLKPDGKTAVKTY